MLFETALGGANIGPPVIADFDGDGALEIGIQRDNPCNYSVYKYSAATGLTSAWTTQLTKCSGFFAATAFDFNGDGAAEVVTHDDCYVSILDGKTGRFRPFPDGLHAGALFGKRFGLSGAKRFGIGRNGRGRSGRGSRGICHFGNLLLRRLRGHGAGTFNR